MKNLLSKCKLGLLAISMLCLPMVAQAGLFSDIFDVAAPLISDAGAGISDVLSFLDPPPTTPFQVVPGGVKVLQDGSLSIHASMHHAQPTGASEGMVLHKLTLNGSDIPNAPVAQTIFHPNTGAARRSKAHTSYQMDVKAGDVVGVSMRADTGYGIASPIGTLPGESTTPGAMHLQLNTDKKKDHSSSHSCHHKKHHKKHH